MSDAWEWTADEVRAYAEAAGLGPRAAPTRLSGGLLNVVWRVPSAGGDESVIAKVAPPFVAALPEVPLDPSRQRTEAGLLALFDRGPLAPLASVAVRPPRPVHHDPGRSVLLMEDVGEAPDLGAWLRAPDAEPGAVGEGLGRFIGRLHAATLGSELLPRFDNAAAQRTRLDVQYRRVGEALRRAGVADAAALGGEAVALGERLLRPGRCLIQGDLWPPSVLVLPGGVLRVIDWELAHAGVPAQDLGHLGAHLWMLAHRRPAAADAAHSAWAGVLRGYAEAAGPALPRLLDEGTWADATRHAGCEVLVRAVGPFQGGSVYDGLGPDAPAVREAVAVAARALRDPGGFAVVGALR